MSYATTGGRHAGARHRPRGVLVLPFVVFLALTFLAVSYVAYVLWPRWPEPPVAVDAPPLPIVIAGVTFHVPPAAIRVQMQRRPGAQARVDLVFLWPSLTPPDTDAPGGPAAAVAANALDRVFVAIAASGGTLSPMERVKTIYPRYLVSDASAGPDGLSMRAFRSDTAYRGEDLLYPTQASEQFLVRCSRPGAGPTPGTCLYERRIGEADVTVRFPRDWLNTWRSVMTGIDRLIDSLRPQAS